MFVGGLPEEREDSIYQLAFEASTGGILLIGDGGRVLDANPQACRLLGYTREEVLKAELRSIFDLSTPGFIEAHEQARNSRSFEGTVSMARKDATTFSARLSVLGSTEGEEERFAVAFWDAGEQRAIQQSLRRSLDLLLAVHEGGEILGSTLDEREVGERFLNVMEGLSPLTAAVISGRDEGEHLIPRYATGLENLPEEARRSPAASAARLGVLEEGKHRVFSPSEGLVGLCVPLRVKERVTGVFEAYGPPSLLEEETVDILRSLCLQVSGALENARLYRELASREREVEELVGKLLSAQEEERGRLALEVHDEITQLASAAHRRLQTFARRHPPATESEGRELERIRELVEETVSVARRIIADLRPPVLDDLGPAAAVRQCVEKLRGEGRDVSYEEDLGEGRLPRDVELALFRVAQEALANVGKHVPPQRPARAELRLEEDAVRLLVADWGDGFDPVRQADGESPGERVGISGMRERAKLAGGSLELESYPGRGTRLSARIPLSPDGSASDG